ncbi:hypothetical protein Gpo141_00006647 [Globisporangium polare]
MDLYADLPLAKGASSSALDADGKLKTGGGPGSSVWKTTAPAFVPQVMRNSSNASQQQAGRGKALPPAINTKSPVSMLPAALRNKSPHGATASSAGSSTTTSPASAADGVKKASSISLAFRPASVTRKPLASPASRQIPSPPPTNLKVDTQPAVSTPCSMEAKLEDAELRPRGIGFGFSTVTTTTTTTQVRIPKDDHENQQPVVNATGSAHFFQSNYRDEYNPARPNSYEAYCEERLNKKKLEQVKRELERRQQEQEREGKLEREKLVRDIEAGNAPAADLPAAGRGRGMTMPAWMRKKMEETAAAKQVDSQQVNKSAEVDQFDDAAPRTGLGFASKNDCESSNVVSRTAGLGFARSAADSEPTPLLRGEFGREIQQGDLQNDHQHKRSHGGDETAARSHQQQQQRNDRAETSSNPFKRQRDETRPQPSTSRQISASGCVILLKNMVGPGEVDDELQEEVKEECAEKYGPVEKCLIYEVKGRVSPEETVRIFVQFERQRDAEEARLGLNARFFGGRKVQASYYDDDKFRRLDLTA